MKDVFSIIDELIETASEYELETNQLKETIEKIENRMLLKRCV